MDQLSNNIEAEEDKPPNQNNTEKPNFEAFFIPFKNIWGVRQNGLFDVFHSGVFPIQYGSISEL